MRSKSEQDVYLKFLACAYCACEHFSHLISWAVPLLQINLFSIMCMIYCILIHFLCLKESLIFFLYFNQNSLSRWKFIKHTAQREDLRGILVNQFMRQSLIGFFFVGRGGKLRAHLTHFLGCLMLIENYNNFFSWAQKHLITNNNNNKRN